jgi:polysaccharide export outer membrane protein
MYADAQTFLPSLQTLKSSMHCNDREACTNTVNSVAAMIDSTNELGIKAMKRFSRMVTTVFCNAVARTQDRAVPHSMARGLALCSLIAIACVYVHDSLGATPPARTNQTQSHSAAGRSAQTRVAQPPSDLRTAKADTNPAATSSSGVTRTLMPLGSGDVVTVQVYGRPELNTTTYVADDGTIAVPLAGDIAVSGLSPTAASQKIATAYKNAQILRNPQVSMMVTQSHSQMVSVLGEVRAPGRFPIEARTTLLDLIAQAGGTTEQSGNQLYLVRANSSGELERHPIDLRGLQDHRYSLKMVTVQGGDSVYVPPAEQFYIYGEVQQPNMYRLEPDMTVLQAISRGGGLTKAGSSNRIEIKRRDQGGQLLTRKANLNERVEADDVIYVKESLF